jgi:hypothetical protein
VSAEREFLPGLELCRALYEEAVRPVLAEHFPGLVHSAARIGHGSEVLGFDTVRSTDHDWGPSVQLFVRPEDAAAGPEIRRVLAERLPTAVRGWPVHYQRKDDPNDPVDQLRLTDGRKNHHVWVVEPGAWFRARLGADPVAGPLAVREWLAVPQQRLAEVTAGAVFHDGLGVLGPVRERLAWYPDDVWRFLLAGQWTKLAQEEAFVGRAAEVEDGLGSRVVAARQVRELMRLALLQARRYAPYSKWLGSAFRRDVPGSAELGSLLERVLAAGHYAEREALLCEAYEELARRQNVLGLTSEPPDPVRRPYYGRPFQVIHGERFALALWDSVEGPELRARQPIGGVDQWADSTDFLGDLAAARTASDALAGPKTGRWVLPS